MCLSLDEVTKCLWLFSKIFPEHPVDKMTTQDYLLVLCDLKPKLLNESGISLAKYLDHFPLPKDILNEAKLLGS